MVALGIGRFPYESCGAQGSGLLTSFNHREKEIGNLVLFRIHS